MSEALMQLAFAGLSPRRVDALLATHGTAEAVVRAVASRRTSLGEAVISAIRVPAHERSSALEALGVTWVPQCSAVYPQLINCLDPTEGGA